MRNRRGISKKLSVLVDTTFLLPALGIEVEEEAMDVIPLFRKLDVCYLEIALLEALWKVLKIIDRSKLGRVRLGLEAIKSSYRVVEPPPEAYINAIEIYDRGHRDYIDALHYATARALGISWLTVDYRFIEFLRDRGYPVSDVVLTPKDLKVLLS